MIKSYTDFLGFLMFNRVCDNRTLTIACSSQQMASKYKKEAIDRGHIKETTIEKRFGTVHKAKVYTLTKSGLNYFIDRDKIISPSFLMSEAKKYICPLGRAMSHDEEKLRATQISTALSIANKAGAVIAAENYDTETEDDDASDQIDSNDATSKIPVMDYIGKDLSDDVLQSFRLFQNEHTAERSLVFHNNMFIKRTASKANSQVSFRDYQSGRYAGVIDSRFKSVFLFAAPMFGMGWHKWINAKEMTAYQVWLKLKANITTEQIQRAGTCAALIVDTPNRFKYLYLKKGTERQENDQDFGGWFDHFYIIPSSDDGVKHLRWLMFNNDGEVDKAIINDAINSGMYTENKSSFSRTFPLLSDDETPTALGFQLDAKRMIKIEKTANDNPSLSFVVLCYEWQEPYYKAVMPDNVEIITLEMA